MNSYLLDIWKIKLLNVENAIVILTLIPHCPTLNPFKIFAFATARFNFIFLSVCQSLCIGHASFGHLQLIIIINRPKIGTNYCLNTILVIHKLPSLYGTIVTRVLPPCYLQIVVWTLFT